jgi:hypothetical protein
VDLRSGAVGLSRRCRFFRRIEGGLVAHVRASFALAQRQSDGAALRDHLEARAKHADGTDARAQLAVPDAPSEYAYLLGHFDALHRRRQYGQHGPLPIPWSEFDRYAERYGLTPWERRVLTLLDDATFVTDEPQETAVAVARTDAPWPEKKAS